MDRIEQIAVDRILARPLDAWRDLYAIEILADVGLLFQHRKLPLNQDERIALGTMMRLLADIAGGRDD